MVDTKGLKALSVHLRKQKHYIPVTLPKEDQPPLRGEHAKGPPKEFSQLFECGVVTGEPARTVGGVLAHGIGRKQCLPDPAYNSWDTLKSMVKTFAQLYGLSEDQAWMLGFPFWKEGIQVQTDKKVTPKQAAIAIEHFLDGDQTEARIWRHVRRRMEG